jgi:hypothetical protein
MNTEGLLAPMVKQVLGGASLKITTMLDNYAFMDNCTLIFGRLKIYFQAPVLPLTQMAF